MARLKIVGVMGSGDEPHATRAAEVGRWLAQEGVHLLTGAGGGVMRAVADQDHPVLERWAAMADADTTVVLDAHLGGYPVTVLGIESRPTPHGQ